jgi:peptidoglycan/LPS O-acetylase OafA/YrhL
MVHVPVASLLFPRVLRLLDGAKATIGGDAVFLLAAMVAFAVSWGIAAASWHVFEKRVLALKRHFTYAEEDARPALAAAPR